MRTRIGWALAVLGLLCALLGLAIMVILGPDSRFSTGPHPVDTDGIAVVTAPKVITWADVQVDILAEVPVKKPIFVGLGNTVDVQNFVGKTQRLEVSRFHTPWTVRTREVKGKPNLPGAPTAFDWWIADSAGLGGASISTKLPDQTVSVAILSVGSSNLSGLQVSLAYGVKGGFAKGAGLLLLGGSGLWFGRLLRRDVALWEDEFEDEDVVYVYVDEDGVEHETSAEEAEDYEIVEEVLVEEVVEPVEPEEAVEESPVDVEDEASVEDEEPAEVVEVVEPEVVAEDAVEETPVEVEDEASVEDEGSAEVVEVVEPEVVAEDAVEETPVEVEDEASVEDEEPAEVVEVVEPEVVAENAAEETPVEVEDEASVEDEEPAEVVEVVEPEVVAADTAEEAPVEVEDEAPVEDAEEEPAEEAVEDEEPVEAVEDERSPDYVAPALKPPRPAGIMTAAEIAGDVDETDPEPAAEPEPAKSTERVVYVYVDENGVEHEVSEDELGDFEIVDEEDEGS